MYYMGLASLLYVVVRIPALLKLFPHVLHVYGFSPVCVLLCDLKGIAARHYPLPDSIRFSNSRLPGHHSASSMTLDAYHIDSVNTCYD